MNEQCLCHLPAGPGTVFTVLVSSPEVGERQDPPWGRWCGLWPWICPQISQSPPFWQFPLLSQPVQAYSLFLSSKRPQEEGSSLSLKRSKLNCHLIETNGKSSTLGFESLAAVTQGASPLWACSSCCAVRGRPDGQVQWQEAAQKCSPSRLLPGLLITREGGSPTSRTHMHCAWICIHASGPSPPPGQAHGGCHHMTAAPSPAPPALATGRAVQVDLRCP